MILDQFQTTMILLYIALLVPFSLHFFQMLDILNQHHRRTAKSQVITAHYIFGCKSLDSFYGTIILPETDSGTDSDLDSCPVQK